MDVFLAFPLLVFAIALAGVIPDTAFGLSGDTLRVVLLIFIIGFFNWPYIGRIVRGQALSLREREYVDAARSLGARGPYIIFREMAPNLIAPILIYATLLIPTNILFEAALSFLGVGIRPPTATWGGMLSDAVHFYTMPHFMLWPGLAIFVTVLAFNLFGDGLRDALDPKNGHVSSLHQPKGLATHETTELAAALAVVVGFGMAACGGNGPGSPQTNNVTPQFNAALDKVFKPSDKKGGTIGLPTRRTGILWTRARPITGTRGTSCACMPVRWSCSNRRPAPRAVSWCPIWPRVSACQAMRARRSRTRSVRGSSTRTVRR